MKTALVQNGLLQLIDVRKANLEKLVFHDTLPRFHDRFELTEFDEQTVHKMDLRREIRGTEGKIKIETFLDTLVRQLTVYAVTAIGLFLIIKDFLIGE